LILPNEESDPILNETKKPNKEG